MSCYYAGTSLMTIIVQVTMVFLEHFLDTTIHSSSRKLVWFGEEISF